MKTKTIVLALALAAVTPAVVSAQENVYTGPGSKIFYISDNALARIRQNASNPKKQEPKPEKKATTVTSTPTYTYAYAGREGHAMLAGETLLSRLSARRQDRRVKRQKNTQPVTTNNTTNTYNPYIGREGHMMALGARYDRSQTTSPAPTYVTDSATISNNHQVTLSDKAEERNAKRTNSTFRQILREVGNAIVQEAPYMK